MVADSHFGDQRGYDEIELSWTEWLLGAEMLRPKIRVSIGRASQSRVDRLRSYVLSSASRTDLSNR